MIKYFLRKCHELRKFVIKQLTKNKMALIIQHISVMLSELQYSLALFLYSI